MIEATLIERLKASESNVDVGLYGDIASPVSATMGAFQQVQEKARQLRAAIATAKAHCAAKNPDKPMPPSVTRAEANEKIVSDGLAALAAPGKDGSKSALAAMVELDNAGIGANTAFVAITSSASSDVLTRRRTIGWPREISIESSVTITARGAGTAASASAYCRTVADPKEIRKELDSKGAPMPKISCNPPAPEEETKLPENGAGSTTSIEPSPSNPPGG